MVESSDFLRSKNKSEGREVQRRKESTKYFLFQQTEERSDIPLPATLIDK
jgi:hypothetical protein